jgi:phage gp29-like protein
MNLFARLKQALSPSKLTGSPGPVREKALSQQFQRIGGGLTPGEVSRILAQADQGQPQRLIDLFNESRQKDGHLQGICGTRDGAVALCDLQFVTSEDGKLRDKKAIQLCERVVDEFENWPTLIEHLTGSYIHGHATAELLWRKTSDGLLLPYKCKPTNPRDFVFSQANGELRYCPTPGAAEHDLLAENPGRIVQIQRRIIGDVQLREGMSRVLVWSALFRNWDLRDWIALGEVGWKPWRLGKYKAGASQEEIDDLVRLLENVGASGVGVFPEEAAVTVEWPKSQATSSTGVHRELFECIGREMSKAVLGQTTSTEAGPNGDRASTQTRDNIRLDIRERDAIAVSAVLRAHMFGPVVRYNIGDAPRIPVPWFETDEATDQVAFATCVEKLAAAQVRIPAKWVRDELGCPEPKEGEEVIGNTPPVADPPANNQTDSEAA